MEKYTFLLKVSKEKIEIDIKDIKKSYQQYILIFRITVYHADGYLL